MPQTETLLTGLLACAWLWRICSSIYAVYSISSAVSPECFGTKFKIYLSAFQLLLTIVMSLIPMSNFPRISLMYRIISIPSQAYTLYYANVYIAPIIDSQRVTVFLYVITVVCVVETAYKIKMDWSRIE
ncbi:unnamed protein product [Colias eurytheme]|nr:unnamed protein product [Colias eurytheme]